MAEENICPACEAPLRPMRGELKCPSSLCPGVPEVVEEEKAVVEEVVEEAPAEEPKEEKPVEKPKKKATPKKKAAKKA